MTSLVEEGSAPACPVEIVEHILDYCGSVIVYRHHSSMQTWIVFCDTLRSCALVCKPWLPRTRYNLFRLVNLMKSPSLSRLITALKSNPHLRFFVRALIVRYVDISPSVFTILAGHLPRLQAIQLGFSGRFTDDKYFPKSLALYSKITMLTISVCMHVRHIRRILHALPSLDFLEFTKPPIQDDLLAVDGLHYKPRCCISVLVTTTTPIISADHGGPPRDKAAWHSLYRSFLQTPWLISGVKRFHMEIVGSAPTIARDAQMVSSLLAAICPSLEEAYIYLDNTRHVRIAHLLSLSENTNVRHIGIFLQRLYPEEVPGLVKLLSTISSPYLRKISFTVWNAFKLLGALEWELLDEALCDARFQNLLSIELVYPVSLNQFASNNQLHRCASRGLVVVRGSSLKTEDLNHCWIQHAPEWARELLD
ncbi:unnamed protein product [Somion occarium]|uniref:F-box domain-containing protein n=1 Tax=Somion occarium TaxID=3059160 RepID=A0ABP1D5Y6_9APHY